FEPVLVDEDEDPEEDESEEEEDPQEEEDDMEVDIEKDRNEPELIYPYEEVDPLNPVPLVSKSEPEDVTEVENLIEHEHEDETVPASVHKSEPEDVTEVENLIEHEHEDETVPASVHKIVNPLLLHFFLRTGMVYCLVS
nr:hypothetical protein [Tanacetum cinerariifolium]